jgi:hypothetical protein
LLPLRANHEERLPLEVVELPQPLPKRDGRERDDESSREPHHRRIRPRIVGMAAQM